MIKKILYINLSIFILMIFSLQLHAAFLYKNYIIRHYQGRDILCDVYIVQKNDWVIKIFQQRGEIAEHDFPEFLRIFKKLNPNVSDVNTIRPGQQILIPLKKIGDDTLPGQASGFVSIPFVSISKVSDIIHQNADEYEVREGDCISVILSNHYGEFGSKSYQQGIELFKLVNPNINDLNKIYPGQILYVPHASLRDQVWYASLFNDEGKINPDIDIRDITEADDAEMKPDPANPKPETDKSSNGSPLQKAAFALDAKLMTKGTYYFPQKGTKDLALDLVRHPVMELENGEKILFCETDVFSQSDKDAMMTYWKGLKIIPLSLQSNFEQFLDAIFRADENFNSENQIAFTDHDLSVNIIADWIISPPGSPDPSQPSYQTCIFLIKTKQDVSSAIKRYLTDFHIRVKIISDTNADKTDKIKGQMISPNSPVQKANIISQGDLRPFVQQFTNALGYRYSENINISFPYAGIQVDALSNLVSSDSGKQILIDFGDLYGDAISAIENTGLDIIQLNNKQDWKAIAKQILTAFDISYDDQFSFMGIDHLKEHNIFFTLSGLILEHQDEGPLVIASSSLHHEISGFLKQSGNRILLVGGNGSSMAIKNEIPVPTQPKQ